MAEIPKLENWLLEARQAENAGKIGMYLTHNGLVRATSRACVRHGEENRAVRGLLLDYDEAKLDEIISAGSDLPGIYYIRAWINRGELQVGDDMMQLLIGGDIRPRVMAAMDYVLGRIKAECVSEKEIY